MDKWDEARVERLERKVEALEQKNWDRSWFWMQVWMYGMIAVAWIAVFVAIAVHAAHRN